MSEETTAPEAPEASQEQQEVGLSYTDILSTVQVIDVVTGRGALQGDQLFQVGTLRERLVAFLRYAKDSGEEVGELPPSAFNPVEEAPAQEEAPAEEEAA